ncbi:MAG: fructosamine kinase family protein [Candidatus Hydrogenedentota bacterium]
MRNDVYERIEQALGIRAQNVGRLGGGCVGEVYRATVEDGRDVVVKVDRRGEPNLEIEGFMLEYLAEHGGLPVPEVYHAEPTLLIMSFVSGDSVFSGEAQRHAAELLAACHDVRADQYGLERPTLIGSLHQPNPWTDSWIEFFAEHRLIHMAEKGVQERRVPAGVFKRIVAFADKLPDLIEEPPHPALLHGDVWTTNILAKDGRITTFLDPAVYYGHPEIELAFITLFSTFGDVFFDHYREMRGICPGFFEQRRDIYNMYPLLVHTRLFGQSYLGGVEVVLRRHGC